VGTSGSTSPRSSRNRLPKTASTLPLIGLAGLLALGSAFGIGALRRAYA
jgi:LPXTG-motif cell wall-anchored protein